MLALSVMPLLRQRRNFDAALQRAIVGMARARVATLSVGVGAPIGVALPLVSPAHSRRLNQRRSGCSGSKGPLLCTCSFSPSMRDEHGEKRSATKRSRSCTVASGPVASACLASMSTTFAVAWRRRQRHMSEWLLGVCDAEARSLASCYLGRSGAAGCAHRDVVDARMSSSCRSSHVRGGCVGADDEVDVRRACGMPAQWRGPSVPRASRTRSCHASSPGSTTRLRCGVELRPAAVPSGRCDAVGAVAEPSMERSRRIVAGMACR